MKMVSLKTNKQSVSVIFCAVLLAFLMTAALPVRAQVEVTCPENITVLADDGSCSAVVEFADPIVIGGSSNQVLTITPPSGSSFPVGTNEVLVTVTEDTNIVASCVFTVTVVEAEAPVISDVVVDKEMLWPPNHRMVDVTLSYQVTDNCDSAPSITLSVTSSEAEDALGSGKTKPDWEIVDANTARLRAERAGRGPGRLYTVTITATDKSGNSSSQEVTVMVPHSRGKALGHLKDKGHGKARGKSRALCL